MSPDEAGQFQVIAISTLCLFIQTFQEFQLSGVADNVALVANVQQTGFYRVNYDQNNWQMLAELLLADHASVHRINRAQVRPVGLKFTQKLKLKLSRYSVTHLTWLVLVSLNTQQP